MERKALQGLGDLVNYNEVVPVKISGAKYGESPDFIGTLQSMSGEDRGHWLREMANLQVDGESKSAKISDLPEGFDIRAVSYCLRDSAGNKVPVEFIAQLDAKVVEKLYAAAMEISGNTSDAADVAKND